MCVYSNTDIPMAVQCIVFNNEKLVAEKLSVQYDLVIIFKNCNVCIKKRNPRKIYTTNSKYLWVKGFYFYYIVSELHESLIRKIYYLL